MLIFTDLRFLSNNDSIQKNEYPIEIYNCTLKRKLCSACKIFYAK